MPQRSLSLAILAMAFVALSNAQEGSLPETETAFKDARKKFDSDLYAQLYAGKLQANPADKTHVQIIDHIAKENLYSLHWFASGRGKMADNMQKFEGKLTFFSNKNRTGDLATTVRLFVKSAAERSRDVIVAGPNIASVNAARALYLLTARPANDKGIPASEKDWSDLVLPRLGGGNAETLAAILTDLAPSAKLNEGAKYHLLRAIHDLLAVSKPGKLLKPETEEKLIQAALPVLNAKRAFTLSTPREELEGWKMLRAQALRVLGRSPTPIVGKEKIALRLGQAAGNDASINPPVRLDERIEGAVGLARLIATAKPDDLNADYAAHQVAAAVAAFGTEANFYLTVTAEKKLPRLRTWKADAARLLEAVETMAASKDAHVAKVVEQCRPILVKFESSNESVPDVPNLVVWVESTPPTNKSLFKGDDASAVKPYAAKE